MLKYVIEVYKHQHGHSHDLVIRYYKMLAQLYVDIHEESKAEIIWRELREVVIKRFGKNSEVCQPFGPYRTAVMLQAENHSRLNMRAQALWIQEQRENAVTELYR